MELKLKLSTKKINKGTRIVTIPRKYAKYGDNIKSYLFIAKNKYNAHVLLKSNYFYN